MKTTKDIKYVLVKCNSFLKSPRQIKVFPVMIYIQVHFTEFEENIYIKY